MISLQCLKQLKNFSSHNRLVSHGGQNYKLSVNVSIIQRIRKRIVTNLI